MRDLLRRCNPNSVIYGIVCERTKRVFAFKSLVEL